MSCRGWSSDAYWAARITRELERRGHLVTLGCRVGTEARVIDRARREGVERVITLFLAGGAHPVADGGDLRRLRAMLPDVDVIHVHRGKEHWLAAVANRLVPTPRPIVRTRHIAQAVRPHAANRWLYRRGTAFVVTVTEAIRRQYVAAGLVDPDHVAALPGGADTERYHPRPRDPETYTRLGGRPDHPLVGMIAGLRIMKGHEIVVEAAARLAARVGVVPEVLTDREHAALVPAGDAQALAEALERLVRDPATAARLGQAGRRLVEERYSGARIAAALEDRYTRLVAVGAA